MTERILSLIKLFNISPSDFAEEIGVQRSSISHLISGRNKPSLEFVQRILTRFPEVNTEWLLSGNGAMLKNGTMPVTGSLQLETLPEVIDVVHVSESDEIAGKDLEFQKKEEPRTVPKKRPLQPDVKEVEKIIYFYKDRTFREYYPEHT